MPARVAIVDANVLYSIELTDLLLTFASRRLVRLHWSAEIIDEVRRNLALRPDLSGSAIDYRIAQMNSAVPSALDIAPYEIISSMPVNNKDRHVLALAAHVAADSINTFNLRDFPPGACAPFGIESIHPDEFASALADAEPVSVRAALAAMASRRCRPPMDVDELLDRLAATLPNMVERVRSFVAGEDLT